MYLSPALAQVDGSYKLSCRYSTTEDGTLSRRIYSRLSEMDLILIQYFTAGNINLILFAGNNNNNTIRR